jgi:uncharacterized protein (DUF305 family)
MPHPVAQPPFDQQFIDMMVPHHEGAVAMAEIAQVRATHPEILELAENIIRSQAEEIGQMRAWRQTWYDSDVTPPMSQMPMLTMQPGRSDMGSMNMAQDVEHLRVAPEPFDQAFLAAMIPHHQSAVDAATMALTMAEQPELRQLATNILADQQREITQMQEWQLAWYGLEPPSTPLLDAPLNLP